MAISNGEQELPTTAFEGFVDESDEQGDDLVTEAQDPEEFQELNTDALIIDDTGEDALEPVQKDEPSGDDASTDGESTPPEEEEATEADADNDIGNDVPVGNDDDDFIPDVVDPDDQAEVEAKPLSKKEKFDRYSKGVQRRINKEVRRTNDLRAENAELRARMDALEVSTRNSAIIKKANEDASILDNRLRNATAMKQQYLEEGEYGKAAQVDTDIMDMTVKRSKIPTREQLDEHFNQQAEETRAPAESPAPYEIPTAQTNWIAQDQRYTKDKAYAGYVDSTYDQMMNEGYNPEDPRMYAELDRRIGKTAHAPAPVAPAPVAPVPVAPVPVAPAPVAPVVKPRPVAAPSPNTGQQAQTPVKATGLTSADKHNMKQWGMDPNSKVARAEWLANKGKR